MVFVFCKTLARTLIILFLAVSLVPIVIIGYFSYDSGKKAMKEKLIDKMLIIAQSRETHILTLLKLREEEIRILATNEKIQTLVNDWNKKERGESIDEVALQREASHVIKIDLQEFSKLTSFFEYTFVGETGRVYFSTDQSITGSDISKDEKFKKGLNKRFITDVSIDKKTGKQYYAIVVPIFPHEDNSGNPIGVIIAKNEGVVLNEITIDKFGMMGETGKIYVVNKDGYQITESRQGIDSGPVKLFQSRRRLMNGIYINHGGLHVVGASVSGAIKRNFGLDWTVLAEIEVAEAFAPIKALGFRIIWIAISITIAVLIIAYFLSGGIARPIRVISEQIVKVGNGDLTIDLASDSRTDEVGILSRAFHKMVENFRTLTLQIQEIANVLASTSNEMVTSVAQIATSSSETAVSVSETTTTTEEVKQTAQVSSEKAKHVFETATRAAQVSQQGTKSSEDSIKVINNIREQMESIAESIVRLSEQNQSIGEIMSTVNNLAEQSNILAVNASIEAAKAGEHGRGFAVVAQEVKSLAEQSKQATTQVRNILNDIQKATSAAVTLAEQGSKAVKAGVSQAIQAKESILMLSNTITEASQSATQIAASSQQQLVGMDQVVSAMESIKNASNQNVQSTKQLETASRNLQEQGHKLKELVGKYKV